MKRLLLYMPILIFAALFFYLYQGLDIDPSSLPSNLIDKPFPAFSLPSLEDQSLKSEKDLQGQIALVNVWATWCISCRVEHPYLLKIAKEEKIALFGINYKDDSRKAKNWLATYGNPFQFTVMDQNGTLGLDLGVYGAPESYILDRKGIIRYRYVGVIDAEVWQSTLKPIITTLQNESKAP